MIILSDTRDRLRMHKPRTTIVLIHLVLIATLFLLTGCMATKVVTLPLRAAGEVVGFVPVVGDVAEGAVDVSAAAIDLAPL